MGRGGGQCRGRIRRIVVRDVDVDREAGTDRTGTRSRRSRRRRRGSRGSRRRFALGGDRDGRGGGRRRLHYFLPLLLLPPLRLCI